MRFSIHPATHIGPVYLTVADLDRSVPFYEKHVGLTLRARQEDSAVLSVDGTDLVVLSARASAPKVSGTTGLYHFAILVPTRRALAQALRRLIETRTPMQGFADHGVSEALYLADPDGNGIEIYRDRPREEWPADATGRLRMGSDPLDLRNLLADANEPSGKLPPGTTMGHAHLHVARLPETEAFYGGVLGFDVTQRYGPGALFLSAGGYHHHIGVNTWAGVDAPRPPEGAIGLQHFVILLPDAGELHRVASRLSAAGIPTTAAGTDLVVRDPSGNGVMLRTTS
jgi:catechol 2,3-dioxygenase